MLVDKVKELAALTQKYYLCCKEENDVKKCFSDGALTCDRDTIYQLLIDKHVSRQWWSLTKEQRFTLGTYIIRNFLPYRQVTQLGQGDSNCEGTNIGWYYGSCVSNAILRYAIMNHKTPVGDLSQCYFKETEVKCFTDESYWLPCFVVGVDGVNHKFGHEICGLQIGEDINDFHSWVFFQYNNSNIKPGSWQMPKDSEVMIEELENVGCRWLKHKVIAEWYIDKNREIQL